MDLGAMEKSRPVFVYVTSTHEDLEDKILTFENTVFIYEKLLIALKFFETYKIDLDYLDQDDPLLKALDDPKPMSFYTFYRGEPILKTGERPSAPQLFDLCRKTFSRIFKNRFSGILKKEEKILDEIDKIMKRAEKINEELDGRISGKKEEMLEKELEELAVRFEELERQEKEIFESAVPREAFAKKPE